MILRRGVESYKLGLVKMKVLLIKGGQRGAS